MQQGSRSYRNIAAETGADQHQIARELLAELDEPRDALARIIEAAVIDRVRFVALAARDFGKGGDFASPRPALLAVGEDHVPAGHDGICGIGGGCGGGCGLRVGCRTVVVLAHRGESCRQTQDEAITNCSFGDKDETGDGWITALTGQPGYL